MKWRKQRTVEGGKTIVFALRFLYSNEESFIVKPMELLGVVWSMKHFKCYLFGNFFTFITNHRPLLSITKEQHLNKSYESKLTLCIDRLLKIDIHIDRIHHNRMGFVD